jgi:hypothetical protein
MCHACISGATCMHHPCISEGKKGDTHIRFNSEICLAKFTEKYSIFEFLSEKYPISKRKSSETEFRKSSYDHFKINKISVFFPKTVTRFSNFHPNFIWIFFITRRESGYVWTYKWCIYHQIHADIYIFNKIFNGHKLAQL